MAGTIIADKIQLDTFTDTFEIVSNTDVVVLSANSSGLFSNVNTTTVNATDISATDISATSVNVSTITASSNIDFKVGASQNTAFRIEDTGQLYNSIESTEGTDYRGALYAGYMARAWVNFDGTTNTGGNCDIRASGNVSTVADNGTGNYTVNFTTAMPDDDYAVLVAGLRQAANPLNGKEAATPVNTTSANIRTSNEAQLAVDHENVFMSIFR